MKRAQKKNNSQENIIREDKVPIIEKFNIVLINLGPKLAKGMSHQTIPPHSFMSENISSTIVLEPVTISKFRSSHVFNECDSGVWRYKMSWLYICMRTFGTYISLIRGTFPKETKNWK